MKFAAHCVGVEPAGVVGGQRREHLAARRGRQHPQPVGPGERGVVEVHQRQVGALDPHGRRQQGQVVVLHEHGGARRGRARTIGVGEAPG